MSGKPPVGDRWGRSTLTVIQPRSPWLHSAEDGEILLDCTRAALQAARPEAALLVLGVTPALIRLDWPRHTRLVAVDSSEGMIAALWQPHATIPSEVICEWWQQMPLADASIDVAVGDGSLSALPSFDEYPIVLGQLARVLRPGALFAPRCFLRPERVETPEQVVRLAMQGALPTASAFRFRLAQAIAGERGLSNLLELPGVFQALVTDRDALAAATGWARDDIDQTDKGSPVTISFPTEAQLRAMIAPAFEVLALHHGDYPEAGRAPTVVMRRR